jgi:hypothetical protein
LLEGMYFYNGWIERPLASWGVSKNPPNCWDALKPLHHIGAGNGIRDGARAERSKGF